MHVCAIVSHPENEWTHTDREAIADAFAHIVHKFKQVGFFPFKCTLIITSLKLQEHERQKDALIKEAVQSGEYVFLASRPILELVSCFWCMYVSVHVHMCVFVC